MTRLALPRATAFGAVALLLVFAHAAVAGPKAKTFATPEALVEHFVKSVAADDFDGAMEAFGVADRVAHFDFAKKARDTGVFIATHIDAPTRYPMYVRTNTLQAMKEAAGQIVTFAARMLVDEAAFTRLGERPSGANPTADLAAMDLARLRGLTIVRIDQPRKSAMNAQNMIELSRHQAAVRGAGAMTERIALVRLAGEHYVCGFRLVKYGNTWRIEDLLPFFGGKNIGDVLLGVEKISPEEFEARTK